MINAQELRIGNWLVDEYGKFIKVESVSENGINIECGDGGMYSEDFKDFAPILLTPEILEKCGFKVQNEDGVVTFTLLIPAVKCIAPNSDNEYKLFGIKSKSSDSIQINYTLNNYWAAKPIHFLHELQNLYFALIGEELEINL